MTIAVNPGTQFNDADKSLRYMQKQKAKKFVEGESLFSKFCSGKQQPGTTT